jgi:hypothetical protein
MNVENKIKNKVTRKMYHLEQVGDFYGCEKSVCCK